MTSREISHHLTIRKETMPSHLRRSLLFSTLMLLATVTHAQRAAFYGSNNKQPAGGSAPSPVQAKHCATAGGGNCVLNFTSLQAGDWIVVGIGTYSGGGASITSVSDANCGSNTYTIVNNTTSL